MDIPMLEEVPPRESLDSFTLSRHNSSTMFRRGSAQIVGVEAESLCLKSHWVPKSMRAGCSNCKRSFRVFSAKHNCRLCGEVVCGPCSTRRVLFQKKSVRACDECVDNSLLAMPHMHRSSSTSSHSSPLEMPHLQRTSSLSGMLPMPSLSRTSSNSSTTSNTSNSSMASSVGGEVVPYDPCTSEDTLMKMRATGSPREKQTLKSKSGSDLMKLPVRKSESSRPRARRHTHAITTSQPPDETLSVAHLSPIEAWNMETPCFFVLLIMIIAFILYLQSMQ